MSYSTILVGLGKMGYGFDANQSDHSTVLTHFKAVIGHENFHLTAVVENNATVWNEFTNNEIPRFQSLSDISRNKLVDFIIIATPPETHLQILRESIELKPKAILLEKPIAYNLFDSNEILNLARDSNIRIFLNYQRNYHPAFRNIANEIKSGRLRGPFSFTCWFNYGWLNNCSHFIALYQSLISADLSLFQVENFNDQVLLLTNRGENAQFIKVDNFAGKMFAFELIGENSVLRYDSQFDRVAFSSINDDAIYKSQKSLQLPHRETVLNQKKSLMYVYDEVSNYLSGEDFFAFNIDDGDKILNLLHKASLLNTSDE